MVIVSPRLYEVVPVPESMPVANADPLKNQKSLKTTLVANSNEWLTVKVHYKQPENGLSKEVSSILPAGGMKMIPSADFRFAVAVAAFGMLLRDSEFKGISNYSGVLAMAQDALGEDKTGVRTEFLKLVQLAEEIDKKAPKEPTTNKVQLTKPSDQQVDSQ